MTEEENTLLPPGGIALALVIVSIIILQSGDFSNPTGMIRIIAVIFLLGGISILGFGGYLAKTEGPKAAINWLITVPKDKRSRKKRRRSKTVEKTPPAPQSLKNDLFFERANMRCEVCDRDLTGLKEQVHHIKPRSEGGPNTPMNLIVLCPNCHSKAHYGGLSRSLLRDIIKNKME